MADDVHRRMLDSLDHPGGYLRLVLLHRGVDGGDDDVEGHKKQRATDDEDVEGHAKQRATGKKFAERGGYS